MLGSMNEALVTQLKAKVRRGMDDAFRRGDNIQPPGVGYRMVAVTNPDGPVVVNHEDKVEKRAEIDPEAAAWIVRGAEMIAHEGKSPVEANGVVELSPLEFLDRLADLVPPPRTHRHRYHGVFAPNHKLRPALTALAKREHRQATPGRILSPSPSARHQSPGRATWKTVCAEREK